MKRLNLFVHVVASTGWWGAVAAFLVLALSGLTGDGPSACRGMALTGWGAIVPLAALSTATGFYQSLISTWKLTRHWWVVFKIVITLPCTALLVLHMPVADACAPGAPAQLTFDAAAALVVLLIPLALSIYKPRGVTPWGPRQA